ncbi:HAD domain-containing protein [Brevibacterium samyangense]|uniref:Uncharacterized protein n=1 Tax=Brevibacterium samyangense TaxID=366888 RepID=A0ABP5F3A7_9MICO
MTTDTPPPHAAPGHITPAHTAHAPAAARTHVYLDIDGVLVMEPTPPMPRGYTGRDVRVRDGRFVPVASAPAIIDRVRALLTTPGVTCTTVSTWEGDAPILFAALDLPEQPWLTLPEVPITFTNSPQIMERKHAAVLAHLESEAATGSPVDRVLWIDDHHPKDAEARAAVAASLPVASAHLLAPWARECLTEQLLDEAVAFVRAEDAVA